MLTPHLPTPHLLTPRGRRAGRLAGCATGLALTGLGLLDGLPSSGFTLYFRGLRSAPAGTAALLSLLEPLTGTILTALILGERLRPAGIAGAVILAAALVLAAVAGEGPDGRGDAPGTP